MCNVLEKSVNSQVCLCQLKNCEEWTYLHIFLTSFASKMVLFFGVACIVVDNILKNLQQTISHL